MASSSFIDTIRNSISGLFSPTPTVPFSPIPGDVISVFFSLLGERDKVNLGKVCKTLNATYLNVSPVGFGTKLLYSNLKDVAVELAKATQKRPFTRDELGSRLLLSPGYEPPEQERDRYQLFIQAKRELYNFHYNFSNTLTTLKSNPALDSFGIFAAHAQQIIRSSFKNADVEPEKLFGVTQELNQKHFYDTCLRYSSQPIDTITIESFKTQVALIKQWFPGIDTIDIEAELRKEIKVKHESSELDNIRSEFLNPAADSPLFVAIRADLETKLVAEKNALLAKLEALGGPKGLDGAVHKASAESNHAWIALLEARQHLGSNLGVNDVDATLRAIIAFLRSGTAPGGSSIADMQTTLVDYQQKAQTFEEKKNAFNSLKEIAQFTGSKLTGGKLHEIEASLQPTALDVAARNEATKTAGFYGELNKNIGDHNKGTRSQALHLFID